MNRLSRAKQTQVIAALSEGCSIRATVRMTGVSKDAVVRLLVAVGSACADYQDKTFRQPEMQARPVRRNLELRLCQG